MSYAIYLADVLLLKQQAPWLHEMLVRPLLTGVTTTVDRGTFDGEAILLRAMDDERWQALLETLRLAMPRSCYLRCCAKPGGRWEKTLVKGTRQGVTA